jgi:hypothetical protein
MNSSPISMLFRLLGLCCCCVLSACGRNPEPTPAPKATQAAKSSVRKSESNPLAGMVKAVAAESRQQPIELRFELTTRPQVGEAVDVNLNLLGLEDATDVKMSVSTEPTLAIIDGGEVAFTSVKVGESVNHTVILRGTDAGIFVVDVKLVETVNGAGRTSTYSIPVALLPPTSAATETAVTTTPTAER